MKEAAKKNTQQQLTRSQVAGELCHSMWCIKLNSLRLAFVDLLYICLQRLQHYEVLGLHMPEQTQRRCIHCVVSRLD